MTKKIFTLLCIVLLYTCGQEPAPKEILFVCTHGAARSPIAAAYFNKIAEEENLNYRAVFRATAPDSVLTTATIAGLEQDGFDITDWTPAQVTESDVNAAYLTVSFDCKVPASKLQKEQLEWNGTPSISADYNAARDIIKNKVEALIETLPKI